MCADHPPFISDFQFALPPWIDAVVKGWPETVDDSEARMTLAIDLARRNIEHGGGPFGAVVFEAETHRWLAPGVNLVLDTRWPAGHAEVVALTLARQTLEIQGRPDTPLELVTSCEPCLMCMGATLWFGVDRLLIGARGEDAEAIGFDEGPKPAQWEAALSQRGITVQRDLCRDEAAALFTQYQAQSGVVYNRGRLS